MGGKVKEGLWGLLRGDTEIDIYKCLQCHHLDREENDYFQVKKE